MKLCAKATYMSYLFQEKNIPINLEDIIFKTEYPERLDLVIQEVLRVYNDAFTNRELAQIAELDSKDIEDYFIDGYEMNPNVSGLENVCSSKKIDYSFDTNNKGDFVMEVDAFHQAEIDSLLSTFSNTGVDVKFQLNSHHSFTLSIHNKDGILPERDMVDMLEKSLKNARRDVDYLEGMSPDVQNSQVSFMVNHPEVYSSYIYGKEKKRVFSDSAQIYTDAIDSVDDNTIMSTDEMGDSVLVNEDTGDRIIDSKDSSEVRDVSMLSGASVRRNVKDLGLVSGEDALDVVDGYRALANDMGESGVDVSVVDKEDEDKVSIVVEKKNNPNVEPVQLYCDKNDFEESKNLLINSMDQQNQTRSDNQFYHLYSSDGSTLTISSSLMSYENVANARKTNTNHMVYQKTLNVDRAAFTTRLLMILIIFMSLVASFLILLFL